MDVCIPVRSIAARIVPVSRRPRSPVSPRLACSPVVSPPATSVLPHSLAHRQSTTTTYYLVVSTTHTALPPEPPSIPPISQGLARYAHPVALITIRPSPYSDRHIPYSNIGLTVLYCVFACAFAINPRLEQSLFAYFSFSPSLNSLPPPTAGGLTSTFPPKAKERKRESEREKQEPSSG